MSIQINSGRFIETGCSANDYVGSVDYEGEMLVPTEISPMEVAPEIAPKKKKAAKRVMSD